MAEHPPVPGHGMAVPAAGGEPWFESHTYRHEDFGIQRVLGLKEQRRASVSVVIPARNEERTIAAVVQVADEVRRAGVVDEVVVMDSDSTDATAQLARAAGATVHATCDVRPDLGSMPGKGEALWKSMFVTSGDILVFVDADLTLFGPHFVTGLVGAMLAAPGTLLAKGFYDRVLDLAGEPSTEGGRVTELVARPLLNLWWPDLAYVVQPLAGEWAVRRSFFEDVSVPAAYGVELSTLIDCYLGHGLEAIAQVDLGARAHKHQAVHDLGLMAAELLAVAQERLAGDGQAPESSRLLQFERDAAGSVGWRDRPVPLSERPPARGIR